MNKFSRGSGRATSTCIVSNQINATDTVQLYYFSQSTGNASSSFPSDNWTAYALAVDASNATGSATSSAVNVNVLTAINVTTSSVAYGLLSPNTDTGATNRTTTVANAGNSSTTLQLSSSQTLTSGANVIATSSQVYSTSTITYPGTSTGLTSSAVTVTAFNLTSPTSTTNVTGNIFWGLSVPSGKPTGTYTGTNVFGALFIQ